MIKFELSMPHRPIRNRCYSPPDGSTDAIHHTVPPTRSSSCAPPGATLSARALPTLGCIWSGCAYQAELQSVTGHQNNGDLTKVKTRSCSIHVRRSFFLKQLAYSPFTTQIRILITYRKFSSGCTTL
jgi:hypothetical protein